MAADEEPADMGHLLLGLVFGPRASRSVPLDDACREDDLEVGLHLREGSCQATLSVDPIHKIVGSSYHERCRILGDSLSETVQSHQNAWAIGIIPSGEQAVAGSVGILPVDSSKYCRHQDSVLGLRVLGFRVWESGSQVVET